MERTNGQWITTINRAAAALVVLLALFAFILSYSSLQHLALTNGVHGWLSYLWPLLLDFAMIVFSLAILRANLRDEGANYPWFLAIAFASLATVANVLDATTLGIPPIAIKATVKALAPIALVLAFELLMKMLRIEVQRKEEVVAIDRLTEQRQELEEENKALTEEADNLKRKVTAKRVELAEIGAPTQSIRKAQLAATANAQDRKVQNMEALLAHYAANPQSSYTQAAEAIGVSRQTIANYLNELEEDGAIHRNGDGVKVLK
jgi:hypothetical protein